MSLPVLYSFRRCPYAMRARMALSVAGQKVRLREVVLRDKPPSLLEFSPKAQVPVLVLPKGQVLEESMDIMYWALQQADPDGWLAPLQSQGSEVSSLIEANDGDFKRNLDRYKYSTRYEGEDPLQHRTEAETFLKLLDDRLHKHAFLFGDRLSLADVAIAPFIRQFANTDRAWFDSTPYAALQGWLERFLESNLFLSCMKKHKQWHSGDPPTTMG